MTDKRTQRDADNSNMSKDPEDWVTGDEPMTGAQRSYLKTLSEEAHEPFDENLTKRKHRNESTNCSAKPAGYWRERVELKN